MAGEGQRRSVIKEVGRSWNELETRREEDREMAGEDR